MKMSEEFINYMEVPFSGISDCNKQLRGLKSKDNFSLNILLKIKAINILTNAVNYTGLFILSIISIRFCLQLAGVSDNIFYKITCFFLFPFFWILGTSPFYGNYHIEREALIGIVTYALMATLICTILKFLKEFIRFKKKLDSEKKVVVK